MIGGFRYGYNTTIKTYGNINYDLGKGLKMLKRGEARNKLLYENAKPDWFSKIPNDIIDSVSTFTPFST